MMEGKNNHAFMVSLLVLASLSCGNSPTKGSNQAGYFESPFHPGEGAPLFVAKRSISLLKTPQRDAGVVSGGQIGAGDTLDYDKVIYRVVQPLEMAIPSTENTEATSYGNIADFCAECGKDKPITLRAGQKINVLERLGEGWYLVEMNGEILEMECVWCNDPIQTEWWVRAKVGSMQGWILINDDDVSEYRTF